MTGAGLLAIGAGAILLWNARDAGKPAVAAQEASTPFERAREAARRLTETPTPVAPVPAAPTKLAIAAEHSGLAQKPEEYAAEYPAEYKDSIRSQAMSPRRPRPDDIQLYLQARKSTHSMELRTGPGTEYALLGLADLDERYPVVEVKNRWFRIQLEETPGLTAWVAYERVELFSQDRDKVSESSESPESEDVL